jgi:hypothetical protein
MGHSEYVPVTRERRAWNAGRKLDAKRALGPYAFGLIESDGYVIARCLTSQSTASCVNAMSSRVCPQKHGNRRGCFIANSLNARVTLTPGFVVAPPTK